MNRDLFRRYVWLVDTVRHAKRIQYEQIADLWLKSVLNDDNSPLALRTFHNHRHAIENLFGIKILCDRGDRNHYYIYEGDNAESTRLKIWMMQKLGYSELDTYFPQLADRIILDKNPEDRFGLNVIIVAIMNNRAVNMTYSIPTPDGKTSLTVAPYCIRYWNSNWYLIGKDIDTGIVHTFNLDRVVDIVLSDKKFTYPKDFSPRDCFRSSFGMELPGDERPQNVRLRICGSTRDKVRTLPLHNSQKEVLSTSGYSVFEYHIIPGEDFISTVLSQGLDTQVIYPESLRKDVGARIRGMAEQYAEEENLA